MESRVIGHYKHRSESTLTVAPYVPNRDYEVDANRVREFLLSTLPSGTVARLSYELMKDFLDSLVLSGMIEEKDLGIVLERAWDYIREMDIDEAE